MVQTMTGTRFGLAAVVVGLLLATVGCGGDDDGATPSSLRDGTYRFELTPRYMLDGGLSQEQADNESGAHETTLANGSFSDSWQSPNGISGICRGSYEIVGTRVTFRWTRGCVGDWAMTYTVDGNTVTWSGFEALPPHDSEEDQTVVEVFNGVPWTRVADAPTS